MFETYRMLGAQREAELLAEAERLHWGRGLGRRHSRARNMLRRLADLRRRQQTPRPSVDGQLIRRPELLD